MIEGYELPDSPDESRDAKGVFTAKCQFLVRWEDRYQFINEHHLTVYERATWTGARCMSESCKPFTGKQDVDDTTSVLLTPQFAKTEYAIVTLNYTTKAPETSDLISESIEPNAEFMTCNHEAFKWSNGDEVKDTEAPGKLLLGCDYNLTFYQVYQVPAWVLGLIDKTNAQPFPSRLMGLAFPAETLLYNVPKLTRKITSDVTKPAAWQIDLKLTYKSTTWNKFWRAKTGAFERILIKSTGAAYNNFTLADFSAIWGIL